MSLSDKLKNIFVQDEEEVEEENSLVKTEQEKKGLLSNVFDKAKNVKDSVVGFASNTKSDIVSTAKKTKKSAINKFTDVVDKEKAISKKIVFWSMLYEIVMMVGYTFLTINSVFKNWDDASHPYILSTLLGIYVLSFLLMTAYTIKSMRRDDGTSYTKQKATVQNYKSVSVIIKKIMKVLSVGLSIMLALEAFNADAPLLIKAISLVLIGFSATSFFKALKGIGSEIKKIKKRSNKKESKVMGMKHKIERFSDNLKEKNADEEESA